MLFFQEFYENSPRILNLHIQKTWNIGEPIRPWEQVSSGLQFFFSPGFRFYFILPLLRHHFLLTQIIPGLSNALSIFTPISLKVARGLRCIESQAQGPGVVFFKRKLKRCLQQGQTPINLFHKYQATTSTAFRLPFLSLMVHNRDFADDTLLGVYVDKASLV